MQPDFYNATAPKKNANLSINSDLLQQAKDHKINLSQTLELRLAEILKEMEQQEWLKQNMAAIDEYNQRIETSGVFSDGLRQF